MFCEFQCIEFGNLRIANYSRDVSVGGVVYRSCNNFEIYAAEDSISGSTAKVRFIGFDQIQNFVRCYERCVITFCESIDGKVGAKLQRTMFVHTMMVDNLDTVMFLRGFDLFFNGQACEVCPDLMNL